MKGDAASKLLAIVLRRLKRAYGPRSRRRWGNGVEILVGTILSQNTNDRNSSAGYDRLVAELPTWDAVADAPVDRIERCIRVSGLSRIKARRIRRILRQIRSEHGSIDLEFLRRRTPEEAWQYLTGFDGVGPKTALCVLLFAFGMPVFPVDTHIERIARRLGALGARSPAARAHEMLGPLIAPADRYAMHVLLIEHGRRICLARRPRCERCVILEYCPFGRRRLRSARHGRNHSPSTS